VEAGRRESVFRACEYDSTVGKAQECNNTAVLTRYVCSGTFYPHKTSQQEATNQKVTLMGQPWSMERHEPRLRIVKERPTKNQKTEGTPQLDVRQSLMPPTSFKRRGKSNGVACLFVEMFSSQFLLCSVISASTILLPPPRPSCPAEPSEDEEELPSGFCTTSSVGRDELLNPASPCPEPTADTVGALP
jgi:hypothetical protein